MFYILLLLYFKIKIINKITFLIMSKISFQFYQFLYKGFWNIESIIFIFYINCYNIQINNYYIKNLENWLK